MSPTLPPLPYEAWTETRQGLHLLCQMVGKLRLAMVPRRNHWWHVPLYVTPVGLTTGTMYAPNDPMLTLDVEIDLLEPHINVRTNRGGLQSGTFPWLGGTCASMHEGLMAALSSAGVDVDMLAKPYELPWDDVPFPEDERRREMSREWLARFFRALSWVDSVFQVYRGDFLGKTTPVHFFWHSFDLAVTRFSGRPNPRPVGEFANPRDAEAYSHEVVSVGFWPGDDNYPHAAFYGYAAPEPEGLADQPLPDGAAWIDVGGSHMARMDYDIVRASPDPRATLLAFLNGVYTAAERAGEWPDLRLPPASSYRGAGASSAT